jgi:hypothetical protein
LREVEAPTFSNIRLIDGGKVVSTTRRPLFTPRAIVRLSGLGKLKKKKKQKPGNEPTTYHLLEK